MITLRDKHSRLITKGIAMLIWWVPLAAALVGGTLVMLSNIILEKYKRNLEAKSLALAFRGEMIAINEIVKIRQYEKHLAQAVSQLVDGRNFVMPPVRIEREYFPIYSENASRIGILQPAVAESLACAYTYANSFLEDATMPRASALQPHMLEPIKETLAVLRLALKQVDSAVRLIEHVYMTESKWKLATKSTTHWARDIWIRLKACTDSAFFKNATARLRKGRPKE